MQFAKLLLASVLVVLASAVEITNPSFGTIQAGQSFNITWSGADGAVTLKLKNGPALVQNTVSTIATGLAGSSGSFIWVPSTSLANGQYNLEIDDSTNVPNYSIEFQISGGTSSSSSSSAGSTSTGSTTATSTASVSVTSTSTVSSSSTPFSNSTTTTKASSTSASRTGTATSSTGSASPTGNTAVQLASPFALVVTAFLAIAYFN